MRVPRSLSPLWAKGSATQKGLFSYHTEIFSYPHKQALEAAILVFVLCLVFPWSYLLPLRQTVSIQAGMEGSLRCSPVP